MQYLLNFILPNYLMKPFCAVSVQPRFGILYLFKILTKWHKR
jgi:hypothetical protein